MKSKIRYTDSASSFSDTSESLKSSMQSKKDMSVDANSEAK